MAATHMMTVREAAERLGVTQRRVCALINAGQLKAEKASGVWLVDEASVERRCATVQRCGGRPRAGSASHETRFVFMNRTHELVQVVYDENSNEFTHVSEVTDPARCPLGLVDVRGRISAASFTRWWRGRGVPAGRQGIMRLLERAGVAVPEALARRSLGLSLSDQYWICPEGSGLTWEEVNFFNNDFGETLLDGVPDGSSAHHAVPKIAAVGVPASLFVDIDPAAARLRHPDNTSDGVLAKHWVIDGGRRILIKGAAHAGQEPCNEVIATHLCELAGFPADGFVRYELGTWEGAVASRCATFIADDEEYVPALHVVEAFARDPYATDAQHFLACCARLGVKDAPLVLSRILACDYLMANTDRHWRNFGIVRNIQTLVYRMAPLFDTGTSLWCATDVERLRTGDFSFESKPFDSHPGRQLQLADLSVVAPERLRGLPEFAYRTLEASSLDQERRALVARGLARRIERYAMLCEDF